MSREPAVRLGGSGTSWTKPSWRTGLRFSREGTHCSRHVVVAFNSMPLTLTQVCSDAGSASFQWICARLRAISDVIATGVSSAMLQAMAKQTEQRRALSTLPGCPTPKNHIADTDPDMFAEKTRCVLGFLHTVS